MIDKLNAAMRTALATREVQARIETDGAEAFPSTPEQYAADIDREEPQWSKVVKASGAKAIAFANAGEQLVTLMKQWNEFGIGGRWPAHRTP